jgi:hypothetical protein
MLVDMVPQSKNRSAHHVILSLNVTGGFLADDCLSFWRLRDDNFPNLKEITEFSVLLRKTSAASS